MLQLSVAACFVPNPNPLEDEGSGGETGQSESSGGSTPGTTTEQGDTTSSGSGNVSEDCPRGLECASNAPSNWEGPALVTLSTPGSEPACPAGFELGFQMFSEVSANPAICECSCGPAEEVVCDGRMRIHTGEDCPALGTMTSEVAGTCADFPPAFDPAHHWSLETWVGAGGCEPTTNTTIPEVKTAARLDVCLPGPESRGCVGGVCLNQVSAEARHCVWTLGDVPCPDATDLPEKLLGYSGYEDTRDCLDCACGSPDESCRATAELFSSTDCAADTQTEVVTWDGLGSCVPALAEVVSVRLAFDSVTTTCAPSEPLPVGGLVPIQQTTFCCSPN